MRNRRSRLLHWPLSGLLIVAGLCAAPAGAQSKGGNGQQADKNEGIRDAIQALDASLRAAFAAGDSALATRLEAVLAAARQYADEKAAAESAARAAADLALGARIDAGSLAGLGCVSGQIPLFNGTTWTCADRTPPGPQRPVAALILDGSAFGGWLWSVEGGDIASDVVVENVGPDGVVRKHLGPTRYKNLVLQVNPFAASAALQAWVSASHRRAFTRKNGAILFFGEDGRTEAKLEFFNALITETAIPALDASTPGSEGFMTLTLVPEVTRRAAGNQAPPDPAWPTRETQTKWLPSNFRLELAGLPAAAVRRIEAFGIKQVSSQSDVGDARDYEIEPARLEAPNLAVALSQAGAQEWMNWFQSFVVQGNQGADSEKSGAIVFLSPNGQEELGRLTLENVGIFSLGAGQGPAGELRAGLYVESAAFEVSAPTGGGSAQP